MPADNPYQSGQAVTRAIHDAARTRASATGENVGDLTRQAYFDRFLCRVFADDDERFALKGGMGMLARFPRSRHTRDIDLERADSTIETAVADLRIRAEADLGDYFRFAYVTHTEAMHEGRVTGEPGTKITFEIYIEARSLGRCSVDVAIHPRPAIDFEIKDPSSRLHLPRLTTSPYVIIAIEDQIADKLCAMRGTFGSGQESSRVKDLVDLGLIALAGAPRADRLRLAIAAESSRRELLPATEVTVPGNWASTYAKLIRENGLVAAPQTASAALALVRGMVMPVLQGKATGVWDPRIQAWA